MKDPYFDGYAGDYLVGMLKENTTLSAPTIADADTDIDTDSKEHEDHEEEDTVDANDNDRDINKPIEWGDTVFLYALHSVLNSLELNDFHTRLILSKELKTDLFYQLGANPKGYSLEHIEELFAEWEKNHVKVKAIREESYCKKLIPIWRCAVCGQGCESYTVCSVAPCVVRYEVRCE